MKQGTLVLLILACTGCIADPLPDPDDCCPDPQEPYIPQCPDDPDPPCASPQDNYDPVPLPWAVGEV